MDVGLMPSPYKSAIKENAINHMFPGIEVGEQNITIFYCTWHIRKTLEHKLWSFGKGCQTMLCAMYKLTRAGCEEMIHQAITELPLETNQAYICCYWLNNTAK